MDEAEQKIESLRAMLSGERSKSKIARQKADQLAARVNTNFLYLFVCFCVCPFRQLWCLEAPSINDLLNF